MKETIKTLAALFIGAIFMLACQQVEEPLGDSSAAPKTRAYGDKTPVVAVYVETNDTNPLNAGAYYMSNAQPPECDTVMIDIVELFAANIHKETVGGQVRPTLYLNDKLTRVLEPDPVTGEWGYEHFVEPLQAKGIKVVLTILGDWQDIGLSSMTAPQTTQFAAILNYVVNRYGLDGIGFDDEYNGPGETVRTASYGENISKLRALMGNDKLITVFDWGRAYDISQTDCGLVNYGYAGPVGTNTWQSAGFWPHNYLDPEQWSPVAYQLGTPYNDTMLDAVQTRAAQAAGADNGALMGFNLRRSGDVDPQPVLDRLAKGAYGADTVVVCGPSNLTRDWPEISTGYTITYDDTL